MVSRNLSGIGQWQLFLSVFLLLYSTGLLPMWLCLRLQGDLHVNPASSIWVVNAFQLAVTISLLAFSSLGDLWGYKKVYVGGLLLFSTTSLICALSDSFWTLVIARGLQGFGAAAITSVNTALLRIIYPTRLLPRGMGTNALIIAVAAAAGPTVAARNPFRCELALVVCYKCTYWIDCFWVKCKIPSG